MKAPYRLTQGGLPLRLDWRCTSNSRCLPCEMSSGSSKEKRTSHLGTSRSGGYFLHTISSYCSKKNLLESTMLMSKEVFNIILCAFIHSRLSTWGGEGVRIWSKNRMVSYSASTITYYHAHKINGRFSLGLVNKLGLVFH